MQEKEITAKSRPGRLQDKVVLITGAAQSIGFATAEVAVREGAIVIISDIAVEQGAAAAASIGAEFIRLDVTDTQSVHNAVESIIQKHGRIDVLVNNAGMPFVHDAAETTKEQFLRILEINLLGLFDVAREVGRHMIAAKNGSIVNLASIAGHIAMQAPVVTYAASKAAIAQVSRSLANEWAPYGIRVNSVSPGTVNTELTRKAVTAEQIIEMTAQVPIRRLIEPSEIGEAIVFLASDAASAITGHDLLADGGVTIV